CHNDTGPSDLQRCLQGTGHGLRRGYEFCPFRHHPGYLAAQHARHSRRGGVPVRERRSLHLLSHLVLSAGALAMLLPFVWMVSTSLKPPDQLFSLPPTWIPRPLQFDTYLKAMSAGNFTRYAFNSLLLALANMLTNVLLSALAGYAFARLRFPGNNVLF